ncbi:MAG: hypothetical protein KGV51_06475 [Moraxellaceae bacterium]|nr:hypothetical protein [Moraxellaceae bacterium]
MSKKIIKTTDLQISNIIQTAKPNATQKKINNLWKKIQKQKRKNEQQQIELNNYLTLYQEVIYPVKQKTVLPELVNLIERLMQLFERKSLYEWHRDVMVSWISRLQEEVADIDEGKANEIEIKMMDLLKKVTMYRLTKEEQQDVEQDLQKGMEEILLELFGEEMESPKDNWSFEDIAEMMQEKQQQFFENMQDEFHEDGSSTKVNIIPNNNSDFEQWIQKIYRRTARILHPDKQNDDNKKEVLQDIMSQLNHAKDNQDVATLIELYMTHVNNSNLDIEGEFDSKQLVASLSLQLNQLQNDYDEFLYEFPLSEYAISRLKTISKRPKEKQVWLEELAEEAKNYKQLRQEMTSLKKLKPMLKERYEQQKIVYLNNFFID